MQDQVFVAGGARLQGDHEGTQANGQEEYPWVVQTGRSFVYVDTEV